MGVGGDAVDDGVGHDFLLDLVVPFRGRDLGAEDRGSGAGATFDQRVQVTDLLDGGRAGEPFVEDEQIDVDELGEGLGSAAGAFGEGEPVLPWGQVTVLVS